MPRKPSCSPARYHALRVLDRVLTRESTLDEALPDLEEGCCDARDRALGREIASGTCRYLEQLQYVLGRFAEHYFRFPPTVQRILELSCYQLLFLDRVPEYAVISDAVNLTRNEKFAGLVSAVNGILRSLARQRESIVFPRRESDWMEYLSITYSHPRRLIERWREIWPEEKVEALCRFNLTRAPLSLRIRTNRETVIEELRQQGVHGSADMRFSDLVTLDPDIPVEPQLLASPHWVVQDGTASLIAPIVNPTPGWRVWDVCAAPGGKTFHLADRMKGEGTIVATDRSPARLQRLRTRMEQLGISCVEALVIDPLRDLLLLDFGVFDAILLDAPCSGWGTFRRNPDLHLRLRPEDSIRLGEQALQLFEQVHGRLKNGGILVYSTCTLSPEENEQVIERFTARHPEFEIEPVTPFLPESFREAVTPHGYLSIFPPDWNLDGGFAARLRKRG